MKLTREEVSRIAAATGYMAEPVEKVLRLIGLLGTMNQHPALKGRLALKGGTALNLFGRGPIQRLSVDIDLNCVGARDVERMRAERPRVEAAVEAVCSREGLAARRVPTEHAGGKWRLGYATTDGRTGNLEVDLNFLHRVPLWPLVLRDSLPLGDRAVTTIPVLDLHEVAAGKLVALLSRTASRDVFDARPLLADQGLGDGRLRVAFIVYGSASRRDWREVAPDDVRVDAREVRSQLLPVLHRGSAPAPDVVDAWTRSLVEDCRRGLGRVLPLSPEESEFVRCVNEEGEIRAELLTDDYELRDRIRSQPALRWKVENVRRHRGIDAHASSTAGTTRRRRVASPPKPSRERGDP